MKTTVDVKIGAIPMTLLYQVLEEVVVDQNYFLPTEFTILLHDQRGPIPNTFVYTDNVLAIKLGTSVKISFGHTTGVANMVKMNTLVDGEITSIEPIYDGADVYLRIRGYDRGHRLTHGKATRTYGDGNPIGLGVGDADIVKKIASEAGLTAKVDALSLMTVKYKYVMQYNQNDWDFLWARANQLGYQVYVEGKNLHFCPASDARTKTDPTKLDFGGNLTRFEPRVVSMGQITQTEAYGWDPKQKKNVNSSTMVELSLKGTKALANAVPANAQLKTAFSSKAKDFVIEPGATTTPQAKAYADAAFSRASSSFMQAYGELDEGDPFLVAGSTVVINGLGLRFTGKYYVTEAHHTFRHGAHRTTFSVTGNISNTFRSLILGPEKEHEINRIGGVVTGVVTSNNDPEKLGRVQVKYPWLPKMNSSELSSCWARLTFVGGGADRGIVFLPEVNDEVLLAFENGNMSSPYVLGVLYNGKDKLPKGNAELVDAGTKKVNQRVIVSRAGHKIIMDDTSGKEKITIEDKTGKNKIEIDSTKNEFKIISEGKLDLQSKGDLTLTTEGKLTLKSKQDFAASTDAGMSLKAQKAVDINASQKVGIKANQSVEISGNQKVDLKAGPAGLTLQASGTELKGVKVDVKANSMLSLGGNAIVQIQGGIVKIN
ncbi:MAG: VgrG-related protein [Anaerolineaceae bacterium]|nr:VgrG-related protein [Anaerolineaceae bacterium]